MAQARIAGVTIPYDKKVLFSLTYIFGIGRTKSAEILSQSKVDPDKRVKELTEEEVNKIREVVEKKYIVEGDLRREVSSNIKRLKDISCWRGDRHVKGLPVRGQSSKNNNRTVRGNVRRTAGSGKQNSAQKT